MFVADKLIFMELQKTGGSHIRRLLKQYTDGAVEGKHNRLSMKPDGKTIIGSIRNPWDWYVSLWAFGVAGNGAIRSRTGKKLDFDYYHRMLPKAMGKNWLHPGQLITSVGHDLVKPVEQWHQSYANAAEPALFRAWLKLLLNKQRRFDIGEGFGFSPLSSHAGLLTYRYFRLFTLGSQVFHDERLRGSSGIAEYDAEYNITGSMIKTESLEDGFIAALKTAGCVLSEQQVKEIKDNAGGKTNTSERKSMDFYYDEETRDLVAQKDGYLIEKYGYHSPS